MIGNVARITPLPSPLPAHNLRDHVAMGSQAVLYIPPVMTHLYGSEIYAHLNQQQQIRYNHLCGLMAAEQFLAFEEVVIIRAVHRLMSTPEIQGDPKLVKDLGEMINEEAVHAQWFRALLGSVEPQLYADEKRIFTKLRWWEQLTLLPLTRTRDGALLMLWFTLLIEEHSVKLSQAMLADVSETLDARFVAVHRRHLADEIRHLPLNIQLIKCIFDPLPRWRRVILAWIFRRLLRNIARPRRANAAVVRRLVSEFPELVRIEDTLLQTVRDHFRDHAPQSDITHPEFHLLTVQTLAARSEFSGVVADMKRGWKPIESTVRQRLVILVAIQIMAMGAYFSVSALSKWLVPHPPSVPITVFDQWIPYVPEMVLFYNSLSLFVFSSAWFSSVRFAYLLRAGCLSSFIAYACFIIMPFKGVRGPQPNDEPWRMFINHLHSIDTDINNVPSLHVAYVILVILAGYQTTRQWWLIMWGLFIMASTLLIHQHLTFDVLTGAALAVVSWWWVRRQQV